MSRRPIRNVPHSVHERLLNIARSQELDFNLLLRRYAAERFLYRLGASPVGDRFTVKGATLFLIWGGEVHRSTRDLDFSALESDETIRDALASVCDTPCVGDGVEFDSDGIRPRHAPPGHGWSGVRLGLTGTLGRIQLHLPIDIGFEPIAPDRERNDCPTLLDQPTPRVWTYSCAAQVAEKFHALVERGDEGIRIKDVWDVAVLSGSFAFAGPVLRNAILRTFSRRGTDISAKTAVALRAPYYEALMREGLWRRFLGQTAIFGPGPRDLRKAGAAVRGFLGPIHGSIVRGEPFDMAWEPGGPWRPASETPPHVE